MERRTFLAGAGLAAAGRFFRSRAAFGAAAGLAPDPRLRPVRIGLIFPLTGSESPTGRMACECALMAVEEANAANEAGRPIEVLVADWQSDRGQFAAALRRMAQDSAIASIFSLGPPEMRTDAAALVERGGTLMWDPSAYEGGECSRHVIHCGPTPHQQLRHFVPWLRKEVGPRFMLVGGEGPLARELYRIAPAVIGKAGGEVVAAFVPEAADYPSVIAAARRQRANLILSSLAGAAADAFLGAYRAAGLDPAVMPIASPMLCEIDVARLPSGLAAGHLAIQPYFADFLTVENALFRHRLRKRGLGLVPPSAVAEAAWTQIHLFARALSNLGPGDLAAINLREAAKDRVVAAPQGAVRIDPDTLHAELWPKIAIVRPNGRFKVLARAAHPVAPAPLWTHSGTVCGDRPGTA